MILKSRIVLSKILTQNVADKFDEAKQKFYSKEIDEEQLADNILMLREEVKRPEDIKVGDLDVYKRQVKRCDWRMLDKVML